MVNTLYGKQSIKSLAEIGHAKVLTRNPVTHEPEFVYVDDIRKTREKASLVRVYFDDGSKIDCTPDHLFMHFKNGNQSVPTREFEVEAKDLKPGMSVRAVHFDKDGFGYVDIIWGRRKRFKYHRLVMEGKLGRKLIDDEHIHHLDKVKYNNHPANIIAINRHSHTYQYHPEVSERMKKNNPVHNIPHEKLVENGLKNRGKKRSLESRIRYRNSKLGKKNPNYTDGRTCGRKSRVKEINHKVVRVEFLEETDDVYCMEVPGYNWFYANDVLVHNCTFCSSHSMWKSKVRFHSMEYLEGWRDYWLERDIRDFYFIDEHVAITDSRLIDICELMRPVTGYWKAQVRGDAIMRGGAKIAQERVRRMYNSGCRQIIIGVESGSQSILDACNKREDVWDNYHAIEIAQEFGLGVKASVMVGVPGETQKDIDLTAKFLEETKPEEVGIFIFVPYPGTEIFRKGDYSRDWSKYVCVSDDWKTPVLCGDPETVYARKKQLMDVVGDRFTLEAHGKRWKDWK